MCARHTEVVTSPRETAPPARLDPGLTRRVVRLFSAYRGQLLLIGVAILVSSGLGVVAPFLTQRVFDDALFVPGGPDLPRLYALVAAMIVLPLLAALIGVYQTYLTTALGNSVMKDLRDRLFAHLQSMELGFFTSTKTGAIQSRLANDVGGVQAVVTDTASSTLSNSVTVIASLIAMLLLSWELTLVSLVVLPLFVYLQVRVGRIRQRLATRTQSSLSDMSAITQESLSVSGVLLAKVFNRQTFETTRYREENAKQADLQVRQTMTGQSFFAVVQAFFGITPALIYLVAGLTAGGGNSVSAGTLVAFTALQTRLLFPLINLMRVSIEVQTSLALFARIFEYLDLVPAITDAPDAYALPKPDVDGSIELRDVSFAYPAAAGEEPPPTWALLPGACSGPSPCRAAGQA